MTHSLARLATTGLLCISMLASLPAGAQTGKPEAKPTDISGRWQFKTELRNKGCTISGEMNFKPIAKAKGYSCAFVAREECGSGEMRQWSEVRQSCTVSEAAGEFTILSRVEEVLAAFPAGYKEAIIANDSYRPDNFKVKPDRKGDLVGGFKSINEAAVRFWRDRELVS